MDCLERFPVTLPHKSLCPVSCSVGVITSTPCTRALFLSALPAQLSCPIRSFSQSLLAPLSSSQFLPPFFFLVSIICHLVYWKSLPEGLLVPCLLLPSPSFSSSLSHCLQQVSKLLLKGLGNKHFRLCKPNQRYYISTYITT